MGRINSILFRVERAETVLAQAVEELREIAAEPGFGGPRVEAVEQVHHLVGLLRSVVEEWKLNDCAVHPRVRSFIRLDELRALIGLP